MTISGFTIVRNAILFDFPAVESITSILPLVDEMIIVLGDSSDGTEELIAGIQSDKIRIIHSNWDTATYHKNGEIYAHQTDIALKACKGDWCFYIQADEVLHETAIPILKAACEKYADRSEVEGFLLRYIHLYGDYHHHITARHFGYPKEIRMVRNLPDVHSWRDAQSFRVMPAFDYTNYSQKENTRVLNCVLLPDAYVFHYGWSRDPRKMVKKKVEMRSHYTKEVIDFREEYHDYGNLSYMPLFTGEHPAVMKERVATTDWSVYLRFDGEKPDMHKMFKLKYRIINFIENRFMKNGNRIFGFKNYKQIGIFRK